MQIEVPDHSISSRPVHGVFDAANPRAFAAFLELSGSIKVTRDGSNVLRRERTSTREDHEAMALHIEAPRSPPTIVAGANVPARLFGDLEGLD